MGIKVDLEGVYAKTSPKAFDRGRYAMGNQMIADMNPFIPMKDNTLRQTGYLSNDNKQIIYNAPYAKPQFYGSNGRAVFRNYSTPGTGKRWDLKAKSLYLPAWKRAFLKGSGMG